MGLIEQIQLVVTWLDALETMTDEDYETSNYWNTTIMISEGSEWIQLFLDESGFPSTLDRLTAIAILKNFRLMQCIFGFTEAGTDLP